MLLKKQSTDCATPCLISEGEGQAFPYQLHAKAECCFAGSQ